MTAADWKQVCDSSRWSVGEILTSWVQSLKRWFDNHKHPKQKRKLDPASSNRETKPRYQCTPENNSETASVDDFASKTVDAAGTLSWAKLRELSKFFTEITNSHMEVGSGRGLFAAERSREEAEIADEWKALSTTERNTWEQRAAGACNVEE